jgi:hypothetical protein
MPSYFGDPSERRRTAKSQRLLDKHVKEIATTPGPVFKKKKATSATTKPRQKKDQRGRRR